MLRMISRWYAKLSYRFQLEVEASKSELNSKVAAQNAEVSRKLVAQLNAEADGMEENVKKVEAEEEVRKSAPEYQNLTPQERYEDERASKKEKDAAVQMVVEKRNLARQEIENVTQREQVSKTLAGNAENARSFADKIRRL